MELEKKFLFVLLIPLVMFLISMNSTVSSYLFQFNFFWNMTDKASNFSITSIFRNMTSSVENCEILDALSSETMLSPPRYDYSIFFTFKPNGMVVICCIPKSMAAMSNLIFGKLGSPNDNCKYYESRKKLTKLWNSTQWTSCLAGREVLMPNEITPDSGFKVFAIAREPINRLISGWLMFCAKFWAEKLHKPDMCYECGVDFACFITRNYWSLRNISLGVSTPWIMQFHYFPSYWFCGSKIKNNMTIQYVKYNRGESFYSGMKKILVQDPAIHKEKLQNVMDFLKTATTAHTTHLEKEHIKALELLSKRQDLFKILIETYSIDYAEFKKIFPLWATFKCWMKNNEELLH